MVRKMITTIALAGIVAVPGLAYAKPGSPPLKHERHKYLVLYFQVKKQEGKRAPGRQILRQGVRRHGRVHPATAKEVAQSIRQLRMLLHPMLVAAPPSQAPGGVMTSHANGTLQRIAQCESGGNPTTDTGNGFYGKYQFTLSTWASVGGSGNPAQASEAEQDMRAGILYSRSGPSPWPVCGYR